MEKINTILNRKPINSEYINSKQDFNKVMDGFQQLKPPVWNSAWFYGTVGVAAIAIIFTAVSLTSSDTEKDTKLATTNTEMSAFSNHKESIDDQKVIATTVTAPLEDAPTVAAIPVDVTPEPFIEEPTVAARVIPVEEPTVVPVVEEVKLTLANIAGVSDGSISFKDFCDPLGIQVNEDISISQYTIHYSSCAQEVTARVRGSKIPSSICEELRSCGQRIEISFDNIKAFDNSTKLPVKVAGFTVVPNI